jgi:predicted RNase H-like HicB family nuclease
MVIEPTDDAEGRYYAGYFPDLPGCTTMGGTLKELRKNAKEAVSLYLRALKQTGQPVPPPRTRILRVPVSA